MKIVILSQPGDGSCFYHSILSGTSKEFLNNYSYRFDAIKKIRNFIADIFDEELLPYYYNTNLIMNAQADYLENGIEKLLRNHSKTQLINIGKKINLKLDEKQSISSIKYNLRNKIQLGNLLFLTDKDIDWTSYTINLQKNNIRNCQMFVDPVSILIMLCYLKRNTIFLDHYTKKIVYEKVLKKDYPTIVLDYELNYHYELYAIIDDNNEFITEFQHNDPFLKIIRENGGL